VHFFFDRFSKDELIVFFKIQLAVLPLGFPAPLSRSNYAIHVLRAGETCDGLAPLIQIRRFHQMTAFLRLEDGLIA
jgi:hypothetical protein